MKNAAIKYLACLLLPLLCGATAGDVFGQACSPNRTLNVSTGLNTAGGNLATNGQIDPYWQLTNVAPPSVNGMGGINIPNAYTIPSGSPGGWLVIPGTVALNIIPNIYFGTNNINPNQPWKCRRKFSVNAAGTITVSGQYIGDDKSTLNICSPSGAVLFTDNQFGWGSPKSFTSTLQVTQGCYYIEVELTNVGSGQMGFAVNASINSAAPILSNPSLECCANSIISGQKWIDNNCDGKLDAGDSPGAGWTFNLMSGTTIIQTAVSDASGQFYFNNVPNGTYNVTEVAQPGFTPKNPVTGSMTVTVTQGNSVVLITFLNCRKACECGKWTNILLNQSMVWWAPPAPVPTLSYTQGQNTLSGILYPDYACSDSSCKPSYTYGLLGDNGTVIPLIGGAIGLNLAQSGLQNLPCGSYTITITPKCGTVSCPPLSIPLIVICPPLCECKGTVEIGGVNGLQVATQSNIPNANPVSTVTGSFTLSASLPVTEVRMLIDEFRLTPTSGNENCILCRNKPQTWAGINAATLSGITAQTVISPALTADVREFIFNNGASTFFSLTGNVLNFNLGVPGVTALNCCTLKATVCIKFVIRDVNCCEREIMKCFTFDLK